MAKIQARSNLTDPRHLLRYMKAQSMGGTQAEKVSTIAKSEGVSQDTIRRSLHMVEAYRAQNDPIEMQYAMRDLVTSAIPKAKDALIGLLDATELVSVKNAKTGRERIIEQPDKTTRLEAMRVLTGLITAQQPKAAPVEVNVQQNNQTVTALSTAETPEERMRRLRKKAQEFNALPPEVAGVPDSIDRGDEDDGGDDDEEDEDSDE